VLTRLHLWRSVEVGACEGMRSGVLTGADVLESRGVCSWERDHTSETRDVHVEGGSRPTKRPGHNLAPGRLYFQYSTTDVSSFTQSIIYEESRILRAQFEADIWAENERP
jgi:hypothetical protein